MIIAPLCPLCLFCSTLGDMDSSTSGKGGARGDKRWDERRKGNRVLFAARHRQALGQDALPPPPVGTLAGHVGVPRRCAQDRLIPCVQGTSLARGTPPEERPGLAEVPPRFASIIAPARYEMRHRNCVQSALSEHPSRCDSVRRAARRDSHPLMAHQRFVGINSCEAGDVLPRGSEPSHAAARSSDKRLNMTSRR